MKIVNLTVLLLLDTAFFTCYSVQAAEKTQFTGAETWAGIILDFGKASCFGNEPTGTFSPVPSGQQNPCKGTRPDIISSPAP
jgi:hypothetical protein